MKHLNPENLHTSFLPEAISEGPVIPRRYTLTHSDRTGELFLYIGPDYNKRQISGWYTRLMRDEVLAEWKRNEEGYSLHVYLHVSGGLAVGRAGWRDAIFRSELPLVLESIRYGDRSIIHVHPELDQASIYVHFQSSNPKHSKTEEWKLLCDYK
jgi:hypothetical protein